MTAWPEPLVYSYGQALERLSPKARAKISDLEASASDSQALVRALMTRIETAERSYAEVRRRYDYAISARRDHSELDQELTAATRQCEKLRTELGRRNATRAGNEQVLSRLRGFVQTLTSGTAELPPPPTPVPAVAWQPRENEDHLAALERVRREVATLQGEISRIKAAPLPAREIKAAVSDQVDRWAALGAPRVQVTGAGVHLQWPDMPPVAVPDAVYAPGSASRLAAWLHGDRIKAELTADLEDRPGAIPAADRPGLLRALEARQYAWECGEERLVLMALAANLDVQRRAAASCWALLYVTDGEEEFAEAAE